MLQYTARITSQDTPRVGGRNLLRSLKSLRNSKTEYREVVIDGETLLWTQLNEGTQPYLLLLHNPLSDGVYTLSYKCSVGENYRDSIYYHRADNGAGYSGRGAITTTTTTKLRDGVWLHTVTFDSLVASKQSSFYFYGTDPFDPAKEVRFWDMKLEKGTVATDWTPAPEDLDDSVSTVNNSLTALASTLLDPDEGEIHKLTDLLDKHKTDTDKSFAELSNHPLTIDKDGYWQIWSVKDSKYLTTQYQSRGDKGDKPVITLNDKYQLLADGQLVSAVSLKGADGHSPSPEEVLRTSRFAELLGGEVTSKVTPLSKEIDKSSKYAVDLINETQHQLCDLQVLGMSDGGVVEVKRQVSCVSYDYLTPSLGTGTNPPQPPQPKYTTQQIPLTLRSSHEELTRKVSNLQTQLTSCTQRLTATKQELDKLKADTAITPVLNADTRKKGSTLYPQYGDWLLTSDAEEQYISFSGLSAEVGRSIYIQTRKRTYLYSSGHSFFGLPGNSTQGNRWLSNNTTYRFVRAGATSWLVTESASPYPWT